MNKTGTTTAYHFHAMDGGGSLSDEPQFGPFSSVEDARAWMNETSRIVSWPPLWLVKAESTVIDGPYFHYLNAF